MAKERNFLNTPERRRKEWNSPAINLSQSEKKKGDFDVFGDLRREETAHELMEGLRCTTFCHPQPGASAMGRGVSRLPTLRLFSQSHDRPSHAWVCNHWVWLKGICPQRIWCRGQEGSGREWGKEGATWKQGVPMPVAKRGGSPWELPNLALLVKALFPPPGEESYLLLQRIYASEILLNVVSLQKVWTN